MKKTLLITLFMCLVWYAKAQTHPETITFADYSAFPSGQANQSFKFKAGQKCNIVISNITAAEYTTLLAASTITGTLNGTAIANTSLGYASYAPMVGAVTAGTATIAVDKLLGQIKAGDDIKISLIKGGTTIAYDITHDDSPDANPANPSGSLAQLSSDQLEHYRNTVVLVKYVRKDVGYKSVPTAQIKQDKGVPARSEQQTRDENERILSNYTIHVFMDQYGNNLYASTPTGIQQKYHYMIHIIVPKAIADKLHYSISGVTGALSDIGQSNNSGATLPTSGDQQSTQPKGAETPDPAVFEFTYNFFPTSDDLGYTLSLKADEHNEVNFSKSYSIKKTNFYRGSFDVGVFKTWVNNPTYTLVNSPLPAKPGDQAIKVTDSGPNVTIAVMYTWYFSFFNLLFPEDVNGFRHNAWGRSYLDDEGGFLRKIYPVLGVGLKGDVSTNWFFGVNAQPMPGFGIFAGKNIRKINTFDAPPDLNLNAATQDQFDYYKGSRFRTDWAVGFIIDVSVFTKIINSVSSSAAK